MFQRSIGTAPVILPEFWCVFPDERAGRKNPKVGLRINISVFLLPPVFGIGVLGAGLHADSSNAFQTVGTAELRCSTLLTPHLPQQLQQRCRGNGSNHAGYGNAFRRNFGVTGKTSPFFCGLDMMVDNQLLFLGAFGGQRHKASSPNSFLLFCPWNYHGMH